MPPPKPIIRCDEGIHRTRKRDRIIHGHAKCRDCGCDLILSPVTGKWRFSGVLG
jgi:hypothetical protein